MTAERSRINWQWFPETKVEGGKYQQEIKLIARRKRLVGAALTAIMCVFPLIWIFGSPVLLSSLERAGFSISLLSDALSSVVGRQLAGVIGLLGIVFLPAVLVLWGGHAVWHRVVVSELQRCLKLPACIQCGYSLKGLDSTGVAPTCPECGYTSASSMPLADQPRTADHKSAELSSK